ncbi:MAG: hypothetical protein KIPDCIKN_01087 [Haliscomenobacter sp.]|jgi:flagellum-specific peptidoglycan hydrolase FlgJ|nr:hypothetical protein [Haliscomenobacter sp.]
MGKLTIFLRNNWFKIAIAVLLVFIAFKKDISFNVNMNAPAQQAAPGAPASQEPQRPKEHLTEDRLARKGAFLQKGIERLDVQPFRKNADLVQVVELSKVDASIREAFIARFKQVAKGEQEKFGIPASIILGNALLISKAGESALVQHGLNFFGLPCTEDWQGEKGEIQGRCYRYYESAWMSFRDHSLYLTTGKFSPMRNYRGKKFTDWAKALELNGFSPAPDYANQVLEVIRTYDLAQWD